MAELKQQVQSAMGKATTSDDRAAFDKLLGELRPKLHRYCARMTGSVIDGEDVLQDALVKALEAFAENPAIANPEGWLFRIAHNAALDFLRRRARQDRTFSDADANMIPDPVNVTEDRQAAAASLRTFMGLPIAQRSSVVLMDVLGYTLEEICTMTEATIPAVKAALNRGRVRLREIAALPDDRPPPTLAEADRKRLTEYVDRFNARDFDTIRDMLAKSGWILWQGLSSVDALTSDLISRTTTRTRAGNSRPRSSRAAPRPLFTTRRCRRISCCWTLPQTG